MNARVHTGLSLLAVIFTAYLVAGALFWTAPVERPLLFLGAVAIFLAVTWICIFWKAETPGVAASTVASPSEESEHASAGRQSSTLPLGVALLALAASGIIPSVTFLSVDAEVRSEPFVTWTLGGIGALMTIVMVRRRPLIAWIGVAALAVASTAWIGPVDALTLGVVGAVVWVVAAQLLRGLVDRAAVDTVELGDIQRRSSEWLASQEGRRRERRVRVQRAIDLAGPVLMRTIEMDGVLSDEERERARLAEGALRDELRGPRLLDETVRERLAEARRRGSIVTVLDEGGLESTDADALARIRADLAQALEGAASDRIYIRTSPHESIAVTVVGRSKEEDGVDGEEIVDLWREIAHPGDARH
ncbi:hypothetical protein [Microbacterium sp.]|uniref:hypothetical protein n=1 Tax=Microbacterium sp. TaxID=51671 RepID=UPI0037358BE4